MLTKLRIVVTEEGDELHECASSGYVCYISGNLCSECYWQARRLHEMNISPMAMAFPHGRGGREGRKWPLSREDLARAIAHDLGIKLTQKAEVSA